MSQRFGFAPDGALLVGGVRVERVDVGAFEDHRGLHAFLELSDGSTWVWCFVFGLPPGAQPDPRVMAGAE